MNKMMNVFNNGILCNLKADPKLTEEERKPKPTPYNDMKDRKE